MDESLIHAYLDDELDPESRSAVEEQARADAGLARQIGELARLSSLLANGLRPPDPPDLSGAVVFQIRREEARRRARQPIAAATVLALAALLMITLFWDRPAPPGNAPRIADLNQGPAIEIEPGPAAGREAQADNQEPRVAEAEAAPARPEPEAPAGWTPIRLADLDPSDALPAEQIEAQEFLFDLVDWPTSRSIEIEAEPGISAEAVAESLDGILRDLARDDPRYGRFAEPGSNEQSGSLFLLLAGDREREQLRTRIAEELGDRCRIIDPPGAGSDAGAGVGSDAGADLDSGEGSGEDSGSGNARSPILLAGPGSLRLQEAEQYAPLKRGPVDQTDRYDANRQHPPDASSVVPEASDLPSMHDRFPTFLPVHPPTGPGLDSGPEADVPGPPAEVILLRVSQAE